MKISARNGLINLNYQIIHILHQIFKTILSIFKKEHGENIYDPSIRIYVSKIENRITFKIKTGYYLYLLIPQTMKEIGMKELEFALKMKKLTIQIVKMYHILKLQKSY